RHRRVLEDLHARGLRGLALPGAALRAPLAEAGARVPLPLLDLRPRDRGDGALRPGRAAASAAPTRGRPGGRARRDWPTLRGRRSLLVGSPRMIRAVVRYLDERTGS